MIVKVCGIKTVENIKDLSKLPIQMVGLNFYAPSSRYIDASIDASRFDLLPDEISRVGVFVNMELDDVIDKVDEFRLDYVQLHGDESLAYAKAVSQQIGLIKVFRISDDFDMETVTAYDFADFILLDKDTTKYGGSGHKFDWSILDTYRSPVPFLLAGGIGPTDAALIKTIAHSHFAGIDINSKFETSPAVKDVPLIEQFLQDLSLES